MQEGQLNKRLDDFLQSELIATIAVPINAAGDIHIASLVYWNDTSSLWFYFVSSRSSEKFGLLVNQPSVPAACVVGTYNKTPATLQMRGTLTKIDYTTVPGVVEHYHTKRGNTHDDIENPDNVLVCFTPHWARFTEYKPHTAITLLDVS
jgi:general stress protein 26